MKERYELLAAQMEAVLEKKWPQISNLSNAASVLFQGMDRINWAGFYLLKDGVLWLGPFQGKAACVSIEMGKGVCGTAAAKDRTQLVLDVHQFPGHIACDAASRSEIVVPLRKEDKVIGVLDIDSPYLARFDESDQEGLEYIAGLIGNVL